MLSGRFTSTRDHLTRKVTMGESTARPEPAAPQSGHTTAPLSRLEANLDRLYGKPADTGQRRTAQPTPQSGPRPKPASSTLTETTQSRALAGTPNKPAPGHRPISAGTAHAKRITATAPGSGKAPHRMPRQFTSQFAPQFPLGTNQQDSQQEQDGLLLEDADELMKTLMRDPRYSDPTRVEDGYRNGITALWQALYPGVYTPGSWGRNVQPALSPQAFQAAAKRLLPGSLENLYPDSDYRFTGPQTLEVPPDIIAEGEGVDRNAPSLQNLSFTTPGATSESVTADPPRSKTGVPGTKDGTPGKENPAADEETNAPGIGHNSQAGEQRATLQDWAALEEALADPAVRAETRQEALDRLEGLDGSAADKAQLEAILDEALPEDPDAPVLVAVAPAILIPLGLLTAGGTALTLTPDKDQDALADTIDRALEDAADRFVDSAEEALSLYGRLAWGLKQGNPGILEQVWDDLTESDDDGGSKRVIETGDGTVIVPHDPEENPVFDGTVITPIPDLEQGYTETYPEDPDAGAPTIFITPEGEELTREDFLETYPDQSEVFPQGTIVIIENSAGVPTKLDVSGVSINEEELLNSSLKVVKNRNVELFDAIHLELNQNGRLTTRPGNKNTSEIQIEANGDSLQAANEAFDRLVRAAGGSPDEVTPDEEASNNIRVYRVGNTQIEIERNRIAINVRTVSGKQEENSPTVEIQIGVDEKKKADKVKMRFQEVE